jgi:cation transport regulator ChaB
MPYADNKDLNSATKKAHPKGKAQTTFRKVFNDCVKRGKSEETCFKIAHSVANDKD